MAANIKEEAGDLEEEPVVAEINITPHTDIFLVLLIIFMVTSSALVDHESAARSGVKVTLPKANAAGPVQQKKNAPIVTITKDGSVYIGTKKIEDPVNRLKDELRQALIAAETEIVLIRADEAGTVGKTVNIMSVAKEAGAQSIQILTAAQK
jgi:biopolymer transport protein ExbD